MPVHTTRPASKYLERTVRSAAFFAAVTVEDFNEPVPVVERKRRGSMNVGESDRADANILQPLVVMSARGRSTSPHPLRDEDVEMDTASNHEKVDLASPDGVNKPDSKVVIVTNLTRNVVQEHLQTIFGFYGEIVKLDLPLFGKCASSALMSIFIYCAHGHSSWSKPRKSSTGILRRSIGPKSLLPHEWRSTRRCNAQSRTLRPSDSPSTCVSLAPSSRPQWARW